MKKFIGTLAANVAVGFVPNILADSYIKMKEEQLHASLKRTNASKNIFKTHPKYCKHYIQKMLHSKVSTYYQGYNEK